MHSIVDWGFSRDGRLGWRGFSAYGTARLPEARDLLSSRYARDLRFSAPGAG